VSIYDLLGRERGVTNAVSEFYQRILADPQLAHYFDGVDLIRLRWHQAKLLTAVAGGPDEYEGRDLGAAHGHLGITSDDFDRVVGHLVAVLQDGGVDEATIGQLGAALVGHRDEIVASAPVG
jgi:hemoglobin